MKPFDLSRLGQEIRRRRVALGWSLDQFAETCGLTPNYLGTLEAGRRDPHTTTLIAIARGLNCPVGDLLADPETDLSPAARDVGRSYDKAPPEAREAVERMVRVLVKPCQEKSEAEAAEDNETHVPRGRSDGERSS